MRLTCVGWKNIRDAPNAATSQDALLVSRDVQEFAAETMIVALLSAVLGSALLCMGVGAILRYLSDEFPRVSQVGVNSTVGVCHAPARPAMRVDPAPLYGTNRTDDSLREE